MDENIMRVLQMLEEGKISAAEAETLIAALRGETTSPPKPEEPATSEEPAEERKNFFSGFENFRTPKFDIDGLGERISKAVAKVQPEKILKQVTTQIRSASRSSAHWGTALTEKMRTWTDGEDVRPVSNGAEEQIEDHLQELTLEADARIMIENPYGNIKLVGTEEGPHSISVKKTVWGSSPESLKANSEKLSYSIYATNDRLEIKSTAPDAFHSGTIDIELKVPKSAQVRLCTRFGDIEVSEFDGRAETVATAGKLNLHDLGGEARGETTSGDIKAERIGGAVTVATQSGDIYAETIWRGLAANTVSGDVTVKGIEGGKVECKSVSGDVKAEGLGLENPLDITLESISGDVTTLEAKGNIAIKAVSGDISAEKLTVTRFQAQTVSGDIKSILSELFSGTMQVNTVSGDVTLALVEGSNVRATLSTHSGDLRCEHDAHDVNATETLWTGQIGTGAGTVNVQTLSGDIHLLRA